jgi:hypothetical protein
LWTEEDRAMSPRPSWRTLERVVNVIGLVSAVAALGLVGYFASLGLQALRGG